MNRNLLIFLVVFFGQQSVASCPTVTSISSPREFQPQIIKLTIADNPDLEREQVITDESGMAGLYIFWTLVQNGALPIHSSDRLFEMAMVSVRNIYYAYKGALKNSTAFDTRRGRFNQGMKDLSDLYTEMHTARKNKQTFSSFMAGLGSLIDKYQDLHKYRLSFTRGDSNPLKMKKFNVETLFKAPLHHSPEFELEDAPKVACIEWKNEDVQSAYLDLKPEYPGTSPSDLDKARSYRRAEVDSYFEEPATL